MHSSEQRFLHNSDWVFGQKERSLTAPRFEKGFYETLLDCFHTALVNTLGKDVALTFEYAIQQNLGLTANEFKEKPLEAIQSLRSILGNAGFKVVEPAIRVQIKQTFEIQEDIRPLDFDQIKKIAERNYLRYQL